jgi:hypothetical protein
VEPGSGNHNEAHTLNGVRRGEDDVESVAHEYQGTLLAGIGNRLQKGYLDLKVRGTLANRQPRLGHASAAVDSDPQNSG